VTELEAERGSRKRGGRGKKKEEKRH